MNKKPEIHSSWELIVNYSHAHVVNWNSLKTPSDIILEWVDPYADHQDISLHRRLYKEKNLWIILCPIREISKIYDTFSSDVLTQKTIRKFLDLWWQIYLNPSTWVSHSNISNWTSWRFSMLTIGIWDIDTEWKKYLAQMSEISKIYASLDNDWEFEMRFRHELAHDIGERYLQKMNAELLWAVLDFYQKIDWTISPMAWNNFYSSYDKRKELGEDIAEMISLYLKNPTLFDRFMADMLREAVDKGDENSQSFIQCFSDMIRESYHQYIEL